MIPILLTCVVLEVYPEGFWSILQNFEFKATVRSAREGRTSFCK